jgi:hypothetical protein
MNENMAFFWLKRNSFSVASKFHSEPVEASCRRMCFCPHLKKRKKIVLLFRKSGSKSPSYPKPHNAQRAGISFVLF